METYASDIELKLSSVIFESVLTTINGLSDYFFLHGILPVPDDKNTFVLRNFK